MKALKTFSIPEINFSIKAGHPIKENDLSKELRQRLIKSGHISKATPKANKK